MKHCWKILSAFLCAFAIGAPAASAQTIVEDGRVPKTVWSGYWWPTAKAEILKPLAKYDALTGASSVAWEKQNNPARNADGTPVPGWTGLCHGWAAAALLEEETAKPLNVQLNNRRAQLSVGDQKAWLSLAHGGDVANFYGRRFNGEEGDDPNDMAPEVFWEALRTTIKEQKTGIVVDVEPGAQVWNFPAYAYRVQLTRKNGNLYEGKFYVWYASDQVAPNYVGVKTLLQAYPFEIELTASGAPIVGTGRWIGSAKKSHPDFAWVPYLVRSGNDQLSYETVCRLLGRRPVSTSAPEINPENGATEVAENDEASNDEGTTEVASNEEAANNEAANNEAANNEAATTEVATNDEARVVATIASNDVEELLYAVKTAGNSFALDVRFEGMRRFVKVGEELRLEGVSYENGFLHLIAINPDGEIVWLYPQKGDDNRVEAKKPFSIPSPDAPYAFAFSKPLGACRVYAIVSERPLAYLAGEEVQQKQDGSKAVLTLESLTTLRSPSEKGVAQELESQTDVEKKDRIRSVVQTFGRLACDETMIQIVDELPQPRANEQEQQGRKSLGEASIFTGN